MKAKNLFILFFVLLITTICGLPDVNGNTINVKGTIRGNGKTLTMTYFLFADYVKQGRIIYTNYKTTFSKCLNAKQLIDLVYQDDLENISIGLDEIQTIVNSMGEKKEKAEFVTMLYNQARKKSIDIYQAVQREKDVFNRVRLQRD
jgi:ribosomal 50S subunit-recycling heat shock protein